MKNSLHFALVAVACAALAACTTGASTAVHMSAEPPAAATSAMGASAKPFAAADREFVLTAARSNLFEIAAAQMAAKRGRTPEVVQLATMMEQDHTAAMSELAALMRARGVAVPTNVPPDRQEIMNKLGTSSAAEFDKAYVMQAGVAVHQDDIRAFQLALSNTADPELRTWIQKSLPLLQRHLASAEQLAAKYG